MTFKELRDWEWSYYESKIFLKSKKLSYFNFKHGFFNKQFDNKSIRELAIFFGNKNSIHRVKQVHGINIIKASNTKEESIIEADGIISDDCKQSLWIYTADCIPVLIADKSSGVVGACHVGWRGVTQRIIPIAIDKLISRGSKSQNLIIAMGPAISMENYEVGITLSESIYLSLNKSTESEIPTNFINRLETLGIVKNKSDSKDKLKLDIRLALKYQLINNGIQSNQITICPICTFQESSIFHSRRKSLSCGFQWSGIATKF